jgi:site-specific recombinase XerD
LRISEACGLNIESFGTERGYEVIRFVGKGSKYAVMPLPLPALVALRPVREGRTSGPLLLNCWGNRMTRGNASRVLDQLGHDAHLRKHVSPHALRRTFCTSGLLSGIPLRDMQIAMRHSQSTTTELYDMAAKSLDRNASHRVASFLAGATG